MDDRACTSVYHTSSWECTTVWRTVGRTIWEIRPSGKCDPPRADCSLMLASKFRMMLRQLQVLNVHRPAVSSILCWILLSLPIIAGRSWIRAWQPWSKKARSGPEQPLHHLPSSLLRWDLKLKPLCVRYTIWAIDSLDKLCLLALQCVWLDLARVYSRMTSCLCIAKRMSKWRKE